MARTHGASNMVPFDQRDIIASTDTAAVRHLSQQSGITQLEEFHAQLRHQWNFLCWIDSRHAQLMDAKAELDPNGRGPKDATYRKYRWYASQQTLLESVNAFEVFYKHTLIGLASAMRRYIPSEKIKGSVDARVLWAARGTTSFSALIFEHQLFHDLENVDKATGMLVDAKRYNPNNLNSPLRDRVVALHAIFQIRHTLSHNQGRITQSDRAKFSALGYEAKHGEIIDPDQEHLGRVVRDLLSHEAEEFTDWLLSKCAAFLSARHQNNGVVLKRQLKDRIERQVGSHTDLDQLPWL